MGKGKGYSFEKGKSTEIIVGTFLTPEAFENNRELSD